MLGPEHEFSIVSDDLKILPIADKIIKDFRGRIVNFVELPRFTFGKELQMHVMEIKPNVPFRSPIEFEETMQDAVLTLSDFISRKYHAGLLGLGMHPLLRLGETGIWNHRHRQIYEAYRRVFNLQRHGWLNIQSFQLNLPYANEKDGVLLHNLLAEICAYLPAVTASSPVYEGKLGEFVDNRLKFYAENQIEISSVTGSVIPESTSSFCQYKNEVIDRYSSDLAVAGAGKPIVGREWVNSRGVILRFDRKAVEIRVMDEQECIKSDVALSCFVRALAKGLMKEKTEHLPYELLVRDYNSIVRAGLKATVLHPHGRIAREVHKHFLKIAWENATEEEKKYLPILEKKMERGNVSEIIRERLQSKSQKTDLAEAIINIYSGLKKNLMDNIPYS